MAIGNTPKKAFFFNLPTYDHFLNGTFSRVLKHKKRSDRLAVAEFLKNAAIGQP